MVHADGYGEPHKGDDDHYTFVRRNVRGDIKMLVDVPDNEWHHVVNGVVAKVGDLSDGSLKTFLDTH